MKALINRIQRELPDFTTIKVVNDTKMFNSKSIMFIASFMWKDVKSGLIDHAGVDSYKSATKVAANVAKYMFKVELESNKTRKCTKVLLVGFKKNKAGTVTTKEDVIEKVSQHIGREFNSINQASIELSKILGRKVNSMSIKDAIKPGNRAAYGIVFKEV